MLTEEQAAAARTAAAYASDKTELTLFLDMLGLRGEPLCQKCRLPMSRPTPNGNTRSEGGGGKCWQCCLNESAAHESRCAVCGSRVVDGACYTCSSLVLIDQARPLVAVLRARLGSYQTIANAIGVYPDTVSRIMRPSCTQKHVTRDLFDALQKLAAEQGVW